MVPEKRKLVVVSAAIAAAFALTGCAPAGYNSSDYGAQPAANAVEAGATAEAVPEAEATPGAEPEDEESEEGGEGGEGAELSEDEVTSELKAAAIKRMGETVQNQDGFVLYRFDKDKVDPKAVSNCNDDCAKVWPPALINKGEKPKLDGVDAKLVGTVKRKDGTLQLTLDKWPLYTYIGDKEPGQWKGQNVAGTWFVITPEGKKNLTCLPAVSKPVAPPSDGAGAEDDSPEGSGGSDYSY
ncbi:secreted repeat protein with Y-X4-D motif [Couchioplanes caeruleus]|uniref:Secreted repeat protein with Y-X4-D motif n=1 Tax=Couchioplanes caeruleus TaxID=56438 RepID=A0A3N1GR78_9ACTN|nr:secreted repeat protein with Y-X4-D motif [Couchioplanes caeruleus]